MRYGGGVIFGGILLLFAAFSFPSRAETTHLVFGITADENMDTARRRWDPFLAEMRRVTGFDVQGYYPPDDAGLVEGLASGLVDVAYCGNKAAVDAVDRADAEVFAHDQEPDGAFGTEAVLIARKDGPVRSLDDLLRLGPSLKFGSGDPGSTSGSLFPGYYFFDRKGIEPKRFFAELRMGNHETNIRAVLDRTVDVAATYSGALNALGREAPSRLAALRVLWTSPRIPPSPLVWRRDLPEPVKERVRDFLLSFGEGAGADGGRERAILAETGVLRFHASDDRQLAPVRVLVLERRRARIVAARTLSAAQRRAKLAELDLQLEEARKQAARQGGTHAASAGE